MKIPFTLSAGTIVIRDGMGDEPAPAEKVRDFAFDERMLESTVADLLDRYPEAEELFHAAGIAGENTGKGSLAGVHLLEVRQALELGGISSSLFLRLLKELVEARSFRLGM